MGTDYFQFFLSVRGWLLSFINLLFVSSTEISQAYGASDFQPAEATVTDNNYWALANVLEVNTEFQG